MPQHRLRAHLQYAIHRSSWELLVGLSSCSYSDYSAACARLAQGAAIEKCISQSKPTPPSNKGRENPNIAGIAAFCAEIDCRSSKYLKRPLRKVSEMQGKNSRPLSIRPSTIALALRAPQSPVRRAMSRLCKAAPPPFDFATILMVIIGASTATAAALELLQKPNSLATQLSQEIKGLCSACIAEYQGRGEFEIETALEGRRLATPAWAALSEIGKTTWTQVHPAVISIGIELCLSWHADKLMATAFCNGARAALANAELLGTSLEAAMQESEGETLPHWIKHTKKVYQEFFTAFDEAPPPPLAPRSFEDRARTELVSRAAFASHRRRAGILDDTCFSRRQIQEATRYPSQDIYRSPAERRAALWIIGVSGFFAGSTQLIPLAATATSDWVAHYDVSSGLLHRDYSCLASDAARARTGDNVPASFCSVVPAPIDVRDELIRRAHETADPRELGDLIPTLRLLAPRALVYPDFADLAPSAARWARTLAPFCLQIGMDALLAAIICGDFGVTARSKLHYCLVGDEEIWGSATTLYRELEWGEPVPMPAGRVRFGASVVPTAETLQNIDNDAVRSVESVRPPKRLTSEGQLLEFHNRFTRTLAFRIAIWVGLRAAAELSVRANVDERHDLCVDLLEKSSAGRVGALPAIVCDDMRAALGNYRLHCTALYERLRTFGWSGPVMEWLAAVIQRGDVPLLCTVSSRQRFTPVSTHDLLKTVPGAAGLAPDWGRKYVENHLRKSAKALSKDIDRQQRHEVKGQEQATSVSDGSEVDWVLRLKPALNTMSRSLFRLPLSGLRKGPAT